MEEEPMTIRKIQTYESVKHLGEKVIDEKWVYKLKVKPNSKTS